ncbi:MAG: hypothetical protein ACTSRR_06965 [Candidatus Heimdallarchaeaceae archaeon]
MKEQTFLAINSKEFIEAIAKIEKEDLNLKVYKKDEKKIVLLFSILFPIAYFSFQISKEEKNQISVKKKINYLPLFIMSIFLLSFFEIILYLTLFIVEKQNVISYLLIVIFWFFITWYFMVKAIEKFDKVIFLAFNIKIENS